MLKRSLVWFFLKEFFKECFKEIFTHSKEKSQGEFQGSKIGTLRSFYSSQGEISAHQLIYVAISSFF